MALWCYYDVYDVTYDGSCWHAAVQTCQVLDYCSHVDWRPHADAVFVRAGAQISHHPPDGEDDPSPGGAGQLAGLLLASSGRHLGLSKHTDVLHPSYGVKVTSKTVRLVSFLLFICHPRQITDRLLKISEVRSETQDRLL